MARSAKPVSRRDSRSRRDDERGDAPVTALSGDAAPIAPRPGSSRTPPRRRRTARPAERFPGKSVGLPGDVALRLVRERATNAKR
jgi:hypothetical protein